MKKIYYLEKHPVKIGDVIEHNGFRVTVTEELIKLNPELFRVEKNIQPMYFKCIKGEGEYNKGRIYKQVDSTRYPEIINPISEKGYDLAIYNWQSDYINESRKCFELTTKAEWDMQELLDKAKRDYPVGTVFNSKYGLQKVLSGEPFIGKAIEGIVLINTDLFPRGAIIYTPEDGWCEIISPKFTTEDGVDIYGDMKTYFVHPSDNCDMDYCHSSWSGYSKTKFSKYFYHKENALAYIEKHRKKTLKDYESALHANKQLLDYSSYHDGTIYNVSVGLFFHLLKANEPKLYYNKILQLIADDLNGGRYIHIRGNTSYHLSNVREVNVHCGGDEGCVYFKSRELAEKARAILGDKVNHLFNN